MKKFYPFSVSADFRAACALIQKSSFLLLFGLFFGLTNTNAQCGAAGVLACSDGTIDITGIGTSNTCSFSTGCSSLTTEYLILSYNNTLTQDTLILGVEQSLTFDAAAYDLEDESTCINVLPICYDLVMLQGFVDAMVASAQCCAFVNQATPIFTPPGTDPICDVILGQISSGDEIQNLDDALVIFAAFGNAEITLNSLISILSGINENIVTFQIFCDVGAVGYCVEEVDFNQNGYTIVNPDVLSFDMDEVSVCADGGAVDLSAISIPSFTADGVWDGDDVVDGMLDPSILDGDYLINYSALDDNGCAVSGGITVTVNETATDVFGETLIEICPNTTSNLSDLVLPNYMGTWDAPVTPDGDIDGTDYEPFDEFDAVFNYTDDNGCAGSETVTVSVTGLESVNFEPFQLGVGLNFELNLYDEVTTSIPDGVWSGEIVDANGMINSGEAEGEYTLTYSWDLDGFNCSGSAEYLVLVQIGFPLDFISFTGTHKNGMNQLNWVASTEMKVKEFSVERSSDGASFETIHQMEIGDFIGEAGHFSFEDKNLSSPVHYYRIKGIEETGDIDYTKVIVVESGKTVKANHVSVAPNPVVDQVQINLVANNDASVRFAVVNAVGMEVAAFVQNAQNGANSFTHDFSALDGGVYFLVATVDSRTVVTKILKY